VIREPVVCKSSNDPSGVTLITDLRVRGAWQPQVDILFDVRVVDTDVLSKCMQSLNTNCFAKNF